MNKKQVIAVLKEIGLLLEVKGESYFKSKAYYDAARTLEKMEDDIEDLVRERRLETIKGIGKALNQKITELVTTGELAYYNRLKASIPEGLVQMLRIDGLGPKKIMTLYDKLGIATVEELTKACQENKLTGLPGFSRKTQEKILEGIERLQDYDERFHYPVGHLIGRDLLKHMQESGSVIRCDIAGSLRRKHEIIKDIDILASSHEPAKTMEAFVAHPYVEGIIGQGDTKTSVLLQNGIKADLRVVSDEQYPYALHHFTGSKDHNAALRHIAKQEGLKMNEYGIFRGENLIPCTNEKEIFRVFQMDYIPPELRENHGELEAAQAHTLPHLVEGSDIKGIIHVHSQYSDGNATIEELVKGCMSKGYHYLGISDHSQTAVYAGGLTVEQLKRQHEEIDRLNEQYRDFKIFKGIESDILLDGALDYPDTILESLDFVIGSIHSAFNMTEEKMTKRMMEAVQNPYMTIWGHPTGRLLLRREGYKLDVKKIIEACIAHEVIIEINANPYRLDMDWRYMKWAKEQGARFIISPDAHSIKELDYMNYGIQVARKGWLEKDNIINTRHQDNVWQ
ncbi:DNA polymerase/3'-5' exonuclease PolX [Vallitalea pronyensis]|uniref:DNA polymerase beta n=1 Tax=Vallitalea pronyensis TaxID=1348613 RepID=A0A8J8SGN7_9FIRM|nr:DNA polymerase/3'-5' exonuclease PolX [Vallitalea pronyensis]QUI22513.1 DNA polymerase/3'-5' exonuclease PolX [Vallitalea pronyensis]